MDPGGDCWLWTAGKNTSGYGHVRDAHGKLRGTHRVAWEMLVGPIPEGMHLDHLCRVRHCVNPDHLEVVTQRENNRRGYGVGTKNSSKTHCPKGHGYTPDNTVIRGGVGRRCLICECARKKGVSK